MADLNCLVKKCDYIYNLKKVEVEKMLRDCNKCNDFNSGMVRFVEPGVVPGCHIFIYLGRG